MIGIHYMNCEKLVKKNLMYCENVPSTENVVNLLKYFILSYLLNNEIPFSVLLAYKYVLIVYVFTSISFKISCTSSLLTWNLGRKDAQLQIYWVYVWYIFGFNWICIIFP
jgi:hypothetical protein